MDKDLKRQHQRLTMGLVSLTLIIIVVVVAGYFLLTPTTEYIQGEADADEYRVSSKVAGRVLRFYVQEGDTVHAGDTLCVLDIPDIDAKRGQAVAAEEAAKAMSQKVDNGTRAEQVQAAFQLWQQAKAGVTIAQKSYDRVKRLFDEGVTTAQKLDEATATRDAALATERAAHSQYQMAVNGAQTEDKHAAQALVGKARSTVDEVDSYVKESVLTAQADGEVSEIYPKVGELLGSGAPIMSILQLQNVWFVFNVHEDLLSRFKIGQTITAQLPAMDNRSIELRVYYMKDLGSYAAWKATKATGDYDTKTFSVKARPVKKIDGLRPGMTAVIPEN